MEKITFSIKKVPLDRTGQEVDAVVKTVTKNDVSEDETWCTIIDLDQLFESCVQRWGSNWNLEKVQCAIRESEIE